MPQSFTLYFFRFFQTWLVRLGIWPRFTSLRPWQRSFVRSFVVNACSLREREKSRRVNFDLELVSLFLGKTKKKKKKKIKFIHQLSVGLKSPAGGGGGEAISVSRQRQKEKLFFFLKDRKGLWEFESIHASNLILDPFTTRRGRRVTSCWRIF